MPDDVVLLKDNAEDATDEGRAMMQIIHDVAPGATLQFHTATASPRQFEEGFNALAIESDIIVDDITFITEPFFIGNGKIATAVQSFVSQPGKFHFTSAGNLANKGYQSTFAPTADVPVTNFIPVESPTRAHLFDGTGGSDYLQEISVVPGTYLIALQWKELLASQGDSGALEDLDIYIVDDLGRLLVGSNRVNIAGDPTEIIVFRATGSGTANLMITSANGPANVPFRYIAFFTADANGNPDGLKFEQFFGNGAPTVSGHAMIPNSITTGAVDYRRAEAPLAETFSSYGGTLTDGAQLIVDLYAPDGGNTASTTIGQDAQCPTCDNDGILNFYGTSAAAPHFAGAMALLMSAAPSWFPDGAGSTTFTAEQALELFQTYAIPFTAADGSAAGFLDTFEAFNNIAAPSSKITELRVEDGITPSTAPFTVKIIGEFFPDSPDDLEILFDDQPLEDVQILTEEDGSKVITATVPTFSGNPELFVVTNGTTPGGTDGGPSNPLTFFDDGKLALNIVANNAEFEYGQDIGPTYYNADPDSPDYVQPFTVEGLPLDADGEPVPFEALGLPPVILGNSAIDDVLAEGGFPIVFDYVITPSFGDQEYDQELFQINFIPGFIDPDEGKKGYLTITKKDLTIAPYPLEGEPGNTLPEVLPPFVYTYGDPIDLTLNYAYDATGVLNNSFYSVIDASHQSDFKDGLPNNFKAIVSKFKAIVSTENFLDYNLPEDLLNGGSWSASNRTIENKFKAIVSGQNIIELDTDDFTNFIESRFDFEEGDTSKFKAIVSKFKAIVSSEDLFSGSVDLSIDNKFKAIVSKFKAIVSTDDPDRPYSSYESVFSIIDAEDAPPEDGSDDERAISEIFSLNLLTGLEVTPEGESHFVYPGAFLNDLSANFNITYLPGSLIVLPKELEISTENLTIPYGTTLTKDDISTSFDGWAFEGEFEESVDTVFPEEDGGIPYYFVKVGDTDETELEIADLKELGDYLIKIRDPKNYTISPLDDTFGTLSIEAAPLAFNPVALNVAYGETVTIDPGFGPFAYLDDELAVFPGGVPYYFKKIGGDDTEYTIDGPDKMEVGEYEIFIYDDPEDNYTIVPEPDRGTLTVESATLLVKTNPLEISYGTSVSDVIETTISGFAYDEDLSAVFPDGNGGIRIPYLFVKGTDDPLTIDAVKELGIYEIEIELPTSGNYMIAYDQDHGSLTISEAPLSFTSLAVLISYGETPVIEPVFDGFAPSEDESVLYVDGQLPYYFQKDGASFTLADIANMDVGVYDIFITDDLNDNYVFTPDEKLGALTIGLATLTFTQSDITVTYGDTPQVTPSSITGFAFDENASSVFPDGLPYYFEASGNQFGPNDVLNVGNYDIFISDDPTDNYQIVFGSSAILSVNKATLYVLINDLVVDEGTFIDPGMISTAITGYAYDEREQDVFLGGLQFSIEDVEGNPYSGSEGVYYIKIVEPADFNYTIVYSRLGTVYVNSLDINRKIRTYTDCVELNLDDPNGLIYTAHFRYENPNDEVVYILAGVENQLTGPAALTAVGELPVAFLPGDHTFEIRFNGDALKWELTSLDSNHKTSTTTNVNANSNKCNSDESSRIGEIPTYVLWPNPVNGILHIDQDVPALVTIEIFDFFGIPYLTAQLDGTNAPTSHQIDMSGSNYPEGMYFIRLSTANDMQVFSVIKAD